MAVPFVAVLVGLYGLSNAWAALLLYDVGIVLVLAWSGAGDVVRLVRTGWNAPAALALSLVCCVGGIALYLLAPVALLGGAPLSEYLAAVGLYGWQLYAFLAWLSLVHPVLEELHWRGVLLVPERSAAARDAAFAAYHVLVLRRFVGTVWVVSVFAALVVVGWLWRRATLTTGGLAVPVVAHTAADTAVALAVIALVR
jgi:membrane protease YdiL (CAAX protease family)